jgi:hypothetical protein
LKSKVAELGIASFDFSKVKIINPIESWELWLCKHLLWASKE